jgi:hypothetical protein
MLNLGAHARKIVQNQKFRIPKVEANVSDKFMTTLSNCILDDTLGALKQDMDENVQYEEVEFSEENLVALDDSEVARMVRHHQQASNGNGELYVNYSLTTQCVLPTGCRSCATMCSTNSRTLTFTHLQELFPLLSPV